MLGYGERMTNFGEPRTCEVDRTLLLPTSLNRPKEADPDILVKAQQLLATEHVLQEKIKSGATIGELINVHEVFENGFAYQERATEGDQE